MYLLQTIADEREFLREKHILEPEPEPEPEAAAAAAAAAAQAQAPVDWKVNGGDLMIQCKLMIVF